MQVKDKEKKLKPIKQPIKPARSLVGTISESVAHTTPQ